MTNHPIPPECLTSRATNRLSLGAFCLLLLSGATAGCSTPAAPDPPAHAESAQAAKPSVPPEIAAVAAASLGRGASVIHFGDLAGNGHAEVIVANRSVGSEPSGGGTVFTRAAIFERVGTRWAEVLRCDEYLKNPNGFLEGTPRDPVTKWRLEIRGPRGEGDRGLVFTPLQGAGATSMPAQVAAIVVQWNPAASRYQSIDAGSGRFLPEQTSLETPVSPLR